MRDNTRILGVVLKVLGLLLVVAAVLKGHELLTTPTANRDIWSWRPFLIFQVEFELALGLWLFSGLFLRGAWLAGLACFCGFSAITMYKGLSGAASCGCFGSVHVNPWITLAAVDLPAVALLGIVRPRRLWTAWRCSWILAGRVLHLALRAVRRLAWRSHGHLGVILSRPLAEVLSVRFLVTEGVVVLVLSTTTPILALNEPPAVTAVYEVLEPETWVGRDLPILQHIDIAEQLGQGVWLVLFHHRDCPRCRRVIPLYERMAGDLAKKGHFLRIAMIEVPPYGPAGPSPGSACARGRLAAVKEWFITTPAVVLIHERKVRSGWQGKAPGLDSVESELRTLRREQGSPDRADGGSTGKPQAWQAPATAGMQTYVLPAKAGAQTGSWM